MTLNLFIRKVFLEETQMRFGDMKNALTDYFDDNFVDYRRYQSLMDNDGSLMSVLSMGVFAMLKTVASVDRQAKEELLRTYVITLSHLIQTTNYMQDNENSLIQYFRSFWGYPSSSSPVSSVDHEFSDTLQEIQEWVGDHDFHLEYMILLALVTLAYYQTFPEGKRDWQHALQQMIAMDTEHGFYDHSESRVPVTFGDR